MPKAKETRMKWYVCIVECELKNLKNKRNKTLKSGRTAVATGLTQPISDFVDDRQHKLRYIDYAYQDMPGRSGRKAPAHLISYYGAGKIYETNLKTPPKVGFSTHLLDRTSGGAELVSDEELFKQGFDKSGFPIFWDGKTYIKEKTLFLEDLQKKHKAPPQYFNDIIPDPNTSASGHDKDFFEIMGKKTAVAALTDRHKNNWMSEHRGIEANRNFQSKSGSTTYNMYIYILDEPKTTNTGGTKMIQDNLFNKTKPVLFAHKYVDSVTSYYVYSFRDVAAGENHENKSNNLMEDDNLKQLLLSEDSRGLAEFYELLQKSTTKLTKEEFKKFKEFAEIAGYEVKDAESSNFMAAITSSPNSYQKDIIYQNIKRRVGGAVIDFFDAHPCQKYRGVYQRLHLYGGVLENLFIYGYPYLSYIYGNFNLDAQILFAQYMKHAFAGENYRRNKKLLSIMHLILEKHPDKLITHRILEQIHMQTRRKPYIPKNPVTYDPAIHVDEDTHEKISHNIHEAIMKKQGKTSYNYGETKPKESKKIILENDDIKKILKPHEDHLIKNAPKKGKKTIWDL